jgi:hypothetical protein
MSKTDEEISEQNRKNGQQYQTHGIYAFEARGPDALAPEKISRLAELRALAATESGRLDLRKELTARLGLLVEMGFSQMRKDAEAGKDIFSSSVIKSFGVFANTFLRSLDNWPKDAEKPKDILEALRGEGAPE